MGLIQPAHRARSPSPAPGEIQPPVQKGIRFRGCPARAAAAAPSVPGGAAGGCPRRFALWQQPGQRKCNPCGCPGWRSQQPPSFLALCNISSAGKLDLPNFCLPCNFPLPGSLAKDVRAGAPRKGNGNARSTHVHRSPPPCAPIGLFPRARLRSDRKWVKPLATGRREDANKRLAWMTPSRPAYGRSAYEARRHPIGS